MRNLTVDSDRLWSTIMDMAEIGPGVAGGSCRLALSDFDKEGRDLFVRWCEEAGCTVRVDKVGNMFARRPGTTPDTPAVMTGSHLDTQPTGGKFDGVLGVLAGLEVIRTLNDRGIETGAPVEVACWTNEEGSRFSPAMMGSGVYAGIFPLDEVLAKEAQDTGSTYGTDLERIGYAGDVEPGDQVPGRYFELHIEQGPILEGEEKTIGVVTGAQGQRWFEITVTGMESHAGPTPMPVRKDALVAASKIVGEVNRIGHAFPPNACATVGRLDTHPNSRNVIPGKVFMTVDFRHPVQETLDAMAMDLKDFCAATQDASGCTVDLVDFWHFPPTPFDTACVDAVREGAATMGFSHRDIVSGAGHDAVHVAKLAPTGMIFIPCEDGVSHNEAENATQEDCAAGANVLLQAMLSSAGAAE